MKLRELLKHISPGDLIICNTCSAPLKYAGIGSDGKVYVNKEHSLFEINESADWRKFE